MAHVAESPNSNRDVMVVDFNHPVAGFKRAPHLRHPAISYSRVGGNPVFAQKIGPPPSRGATEQEVFITLGGPWVAHTSRVVRMQAASRAGGEPPRERAIDADGLPC